MTFIYSTLLITNDLPFPIINITELLQRQIRSFLHNLRLILAVVILHIVPPDTVDVGEVQAVRGE